jgi:hypothetical protein
LGQKRERKDHRQCARQHECIRRTSREHGEIVNEKRRSHPGLQRHTSSEPRSCAGLCGEKASNQ